MTAGNTEQEQGFSLTPIGILHGDIRSRAEAPKNYTESTHVGVIEIFPRFRPAMEGIAEGQTIVVLFWLHQAERDILRVHPRGDTSRPKRGVFATRSPVRPNPIAISELLVTKVEEGRLHIKGVDILDGTPVLDIKKTISKES